MSESMYDLMNALRVARIQHALNLNTAAYYRTADPNELGISNTKEMCAIYLNVARLDRLEIKRLKMAITDHSM